MKALILFVVTIVTLQKGYANQIDSLRTKEQVLEFLAFHLDHSKIAFLYNFPNVSQTLKIQSYFSHPDTLNDTTMVVDPETNKDVLKYSTYINNPYKSLYRQDTSHYDDLPPWEEIQEFVTHRYPVYFYKADIDQNGLTDLVFYASVTLVVMDMGGKFEGYFLNSLYNTNSINFRSVAKLPDGSTALLFSHDYNKCIPQWHVLNGKVTYVTINTNIKTEIKIDTIYKIYSGVDTETLGKCHSPNNKLLHPYADTVVIKLANQTDTVVYQYGGFVKYNRYHKAAHIVKIAYHTVYGGTWVNRNSCIEIQKGGRCFLQYPTKKQYSGFSGVLDGKTINQLWNLIAYASLGAAKPDYRCSWSQRGTYILTLYFDDGKTKTIICSSIAPFLSLGSISKTILDISTTVNWQHSEVRTDFECPCTLPPFPDEDSENCDCNDPEQHVVY